MKIGYVRVSKKEQHEALQIDALKEAGCEKWFVEQIDAATPTRLLHAQCHSPTRSKKVASSPPPTIPPQISHRHTSANLAHPLLRYFRDSLAGSLVSFLL